MKRRRRVAILVGQADEYYQAEFISGFEEQAFSYDWDVCVFSMYQKYQSSTAREQGESSIYALVPYEKFDGIVLMLDTLQTPGLADAVEEAKAAADFVTALPGGRGCIREGIEMILKAQGKWHFDEDRYDLLY